MQQHLGIIGAYIVLAGYIPYCVAILRKKVKLSLATWSMWSVMIIITLISQIAAGKKDPWGVLAATGGTILVTILLLIYGDKKWTKFDTRCLFLAATSMLVCFVAGPVAGQIASLTALNIAGVPAIKNVWDNPRNDSKLVWAMFSVGYALTVVAVSNWTSISDWIQPVQSTAFGLVMFSLMLRRKS